MTNGQPSATHSRQLSPSELSAALFSVTIIITVNVVGSIDIDVLDAAWSTLRSEHPVLGGWLEKDDSQLTASEFSISLLVPVNPPKSNINYQAFGQEPVVVAPSQRQGLAWVDVVEREGSFVVSLEVSHAIADGRLATYWFARLWSHYTDLKRGDAPTVEASSMPESVETLLAERGIKKSEKFATRISAAYPVDLPPTDFRIWSRERVRLTEDVTERLRTKARQAGSTIHGIVVGAIALLERRRMPLTGRGVVDLVVNSPVDIRNRLVPPVTVRDGTSIVGIAEALLRVKPNSDPVILGIKLIEQLTEDLESGRVRESLLHMPDPPDQAARRVPQILTTNFGVIPDMRTPEGVFITDFLVWVPSDSGAITAALESNPGQELPPGALSPMYIISTFEGQLGIDIRLFLPAHTAHAHALELETLFIEIARDDGPAPEGGIAK